MNVSESVDVNTVLKWFLSVKRGERRPSPEQAREALARLADRAHKSLQAGFSGPDVDLRWKSRRRFAKEEKD
jgi:hypothetical protein